MKILKTMSVLSVTMAVAVAMCILAAFMDGCAYLEAAHQVSQIGTQAEQDEAARYHAKHDYSPAAASRK